MAREDGDSRDYSSLFGQDFNNTNNPEAQLELRDHRRLIWMPFIRMSLRLGLIILIYYLGALPRGQQACLTGRLNAPWWSAPLGVDRLRFGIHHPCRASEGWKP